MDWLSFFSSAIGNLAWPTNVLAVVFTINGLYKTEVIRHKGPWRTIDDVEYAKLEWVDWFNNRRLLEPIGNIPPAEFEKAYYRLQEESAEAA